MSQIVIPTKIDLSFLGDEYKDDYIRFASASYKEAREYGELEQKDMVKASDFAFELLNDKLLDGKVYDHTTKKQVDVTKDNLEELPRKILIKCVTEMFYGISDFLGKNSKE